MEWVGRTLKGNEVLTNLDHTARAKYEERLRQTIEGTPPAPAAAAPAVAEAGSPRRRRGPGRAADGDDAEAAAREKEAV